MRTISLDQKLDVAYVELRKGRVAKTVEFKPGMLVDFDASGHVLGIEILSAKELAPLATKKLTRKTSKKKSA